MCGESARLRWPARVDKNMSDVDTCLERCLRGELLSEAEIKEITSKVKELLVYESNVVHLRAPCTVVGDIHG